MVGDSGCLGGSSFGRMLGFQSLSPDLPRSIHGAVSLTWAREPPECGELGMHLLILLSNSVYHTSLVYLPKSSILRPCHALAMPTPPCH